MTKSRSDDPPKGCARFHTDRVTLTAAPGCFRVCFLNDGMEHEVEQTARQLLWKAAAFLEAALETTRLGDQVLPLTPRELRLANEMQLFERRKLPTGLKGNSDKPGDI